MSRRVVIIGAGITGTLTAVRLRRAGWEVILLEARWVGAGSSSRTAAGIRQQFSTPETVLGMRYSVDIYRRFPEEVGGLLVPIVENGYLFLLEDGLEAARGRVEMQHSCGLDEVELLDPAETARRFPFVDPNEIVGASWCPSDGFLRPEVVYGEAAASARARGVEIRQGAGVEDARHRNGGIEAVLAGGQWVEADLFIDATNAWSPRTARALGASVLPVSPLKRYLWFLGRGESMSAATLQTMPMVVAPGGAYCHPENAETLMTGLAHQTQAQPDFSDEDQDAIEAGYSHKDGVDSRAFEVWASLAQYLPAVGEFKGVHATTCGFYGTTPDHNPFLGFDPQVKNLVRLVGFSGHGAMFGPFTARVAEVLAEAGTDPATVEVLGREVDLAAFRLDRQFRSHEAMVI